ncbi:MAG: hypothetical protein K6F55_08225 [Eubacterium sp.]|nr:hypothetical protein [Eubacterium sp.]
MAKEIINLNDIKTSDYIKGAVTATGVVMIAFGIKSFLDARKLRKMNEIPVDEEEEFEEYKSYKEHKYHKSHFKKVRKGIAGVITGAIVTCAGVLSFTSVSDKVITKVKDSFDIKNIKSIDIGETVKKLNWIRDNIGKIDKIFDTIKDITVK